jgi:hypothetical protein
MRIRGDTHASWDCERAVDIEQRQNPLLLSELCHLSACNAPTTDNVGSLRKKNGTAFAALFERAVATAALL